MLTAGFVAGVILLPPVGALLLGGLLSFGGVILFSGPKWRTGSLLVGSLLLSFAAAEAFFGVLAQPPVNRDVAKKNTPSHWTVNDPVVGYRPQPDTTVDVVATYGDELVYHKTYTIDPSGARVTPGSQAEGPTYLFIGDSYVFGEGLNDNETLPSQFAQHLDRPAHVVNLGVLGYAPSHLVRAVEAGLYDRYVSGKVAAVVTWISPIQLPRLTGDGGWLGSSPRFVLDEAGHLQHTGSFNEHRWGNPLAGASYLARTYLASAARAAAPGLEREQTALYIALITRLRDLVRDRYGAPLVLVSNWPERYEEHQDEQQHVPTYNAIRGLGIKMVSVRRIIGPYEQWAPFFIPHDGHPNAHLDKLLAQDVLKALAP